MFGISADVTTSASPSESGPSAALTPPSVWQSTGTLGCRPASTRRSACHSVPAPMLDEQPVLGSFGEQCVRIVAQEPAVVLLGKVVREPRQRVALGERPEAPGAPRQVVGRAPCAVEIGHEIEPPGMALLCKGHVVDVVGVVLDRGAHHECPVDAVCVHLVDQLVDRAAAVLVRHERRIGPAAPGVAVAVDDRRRPIDLRARRHRDSLSVRRRAGCNGSIAPAPSSTAARPAPARTGSRRADGADRRSPR